MDGIIGLGPELLFVIQCRKIFIIELALVDVGTGGWKMVYHFVDLTLNQELLVGSILRVLDWKLPGVVVVDD